ncbi:MAG: substrate-binding domain-containing protein [Lachnospiraceae bacterium]|nr:substrate-binding domain-containing protein [Lachnospiraceae bacterium]
MKRKAIAAMIAAMMVAGLGTTALADASGDIVVCSREDGSGTRGAFIELVGVEQKDEDGNKVDMTTEAAEITNSTAAMMTKVAGDENAIGYISLGSLDDSVTAVAIDGVEATVENVESGDYTVVRPFNILTMEEVSEEAQDFIDFILSEEGQAVISDNGYIALSEAEPFAGGSVSGKIVVGGSSSVTPVMEKLAEAYAEVNADLEIEVMQSDSTTGVTSTIDGNYDIGMASRELKEEEEAEGISATMIAQDGIAVIVNNESGITDLTTEQVMLIYTGEITTWEELAELQAAETEAE